MNESITDFIENLLEQTGSYDIARAEFTRLIAEDEELNRLYVEWCEENGHRPRNGFDEYCQSIIESRDSVWESLSDDYE